MSVLIQKHRSPAYPFISLRRALDRAREFYARQKQHPAPTSAAVGTWNFREKSSGGLQTISALKQYGLMMENESGTTRYVQLTEAALRILQDERPQSPERDANTKRLALLPKVYAEMWEKWGEALPDEATVKFFLVNEKKYNEAAFNDLFSAYKDTLEFAKLVGTDKTNVAGVEPERPKGRPLNPAPPFGAPPPPPLYGDRLMDGERIVFTHEVEPEHDVRILARGAIDRDLIEAVEAFLVLQRKKLGIDPPKK
jgi:hypothetical protein